MHTKLLEIATPEQMKSFLFEQFNELKKSNPELYEQMECELYEHIYGPHFNEWMYDKAVSKLQNADGTVGPHWTVSDIMSVAKSKGIVYNRFNEFDLSFALNMVYSDYFNAVPDTVDSYFKLAKAFLEDKDAPEGKAFLYWKAMRD